MSEQLAGMRQTSRKRVSARKLTLLLLLAAPGPDGQPRAPIVGSTRLQKLVFLVQKQIGHDPKKAGHFRFDFEYVPEKYGPADLDLYQDIEYLEVVGLISGDAVILSEEKVTGDPDFADLIGELQPTDGRRDDVSGTGSIDVEQEEAELSFEYLMGLEPEELLQFRVEQDRGKTYRITNRGEAVLRSIRDTTPGSDLVRYDQLGAVCRAVKQQFGDWPLQRLLRYVYREHPSMISKSVIRARVLG